MKSLNLFLLSFLASLSQAQVLFQDSFETYETNSHMGMQGRWSWDTGIGNPSRPGPWVREARNGIKPSHGQKMVEWRNEVIFGGAWFYATAPINDLIKNAPAARAKMDFMFAEGEQGELQLEFDFFQEVDSTLYYSSKSDALRLDGWGGLKIREFKPIPNRWYTLEFRMDYRTGHQAYFLQGQLLFERVKVLTPSDRWLQFGLTMGQGKDVRHLYGENGSAPGIFIDNCAITIVPEPLSVFSVTLGLLLLKKARG